MGRLAPQANAERSPASGHEHEPYLVTAAVTAFGLFVFILGVVGIGRPASLIAFVERPWRTRAGLYVAIVIRTILGFLLVAAASSTRFPWAIGGLGALSLIGAVAIAVLGFDRMRSFIAWWVARPPAFVQAWSFAACAFGAFLIYAAV